MDKLRALKRFKYDGRHFETGDEFEPREKHRQVLVAAKLAEPAGATDAVTISPAPAEVQTRNLKAEEPPPPEGAAGEPRRQSPRYLRRDMRPKE